jgi:hypothetical protein
MRNIIFLAFFVLVSSCSKQTWLPMTSFFIAADTQKESVEIFDKLRVVALTRGYAFAPDESSENNKTYVLDLERAITLMLNNHQDKKIIEVVLFQNSDSGFDTYAEEEFASLMSAINNALPHKSITVQVPFKNEGA